VRKGSLIVALALSILLGIGAIGADASGTVPAKKRCHFVKKKVRGKIKRVRVCTKPKPKPKPKNIGVSLAQSAQVKATIGTAGGTLSANAPGAKVTLSLPAGSVPETTEVALTPVSRLSGLPKGLRLLGGVQFSPENLALDKPATLTIEVSKPAGAQALAWFDLGKAVSRYPSTRSGSAIQIKVAHFSGVAVAAGPASSWTRLPTAVAALRERFVREVQPGLANAATADPLTSSTFETAFAWERQVELLGLASQFDVEKGKIRAALIKAIQGAIDRAETRCKRGHDLTQVERLVRLDRIAQLWGITLTGDNGFARATECAHFEADISFQQTLDQTVHTDNGSCVDDLKSHWELGIKADRVPIAPTFSGAASGLEGQKPLEPVKYAWNYEASTVCQGSPPAKCTFTGESVAPSRDVHVVLEIDPVGVAIRGYPEVTLTIAPGEVTQTWTAAGSCGSGTRTGPVEAPVGGFPLDLGVPGATSFKLVLSRSGHFVGSDTYATWGPDSLTTNFPGGVTGSMTRSVVLRHVPEP
jgi:hypothetical protein